MRRHKRRGTGGVKCITGVIWNKLRIQSSQCGARRDAAGARVVPNVRGNAGACEAAVCAGMHGRIYLHLVVSGCV